MDGKRVYQALGPAPQLEALQWVSMTQEQLDKMRKCVTDPKIDAKTVKITCNDGDVLEGFIELVSDEERDVILQLLSSNNPTKYKRGTTYLVHWDDIVDFQELGLHQHEWRDLRSEGGAIFSF
jgi:hypothetical protein